MHLIFDPGALFALRAVAALEWKVELMIIPDEGIRVKCSFDRCPSLIS
jgi:hypothetical protein